MPSSDAQEALDAYAAEFEYCDTTRGEIAPLAFDALRAVLKLHRPVGDDFFGPINYSCFDCAEPWPCPTVQTIAAKLAGEG